MPCTRILVAQSNRLIRVLQTSFVQINCICLGEEESDCNPDPKIARYMIAPEIIMFLFHLVLTAAMLLRAVNGVIGISST